MAEVDADVATAEGTSIEEETKSPVSTTSDANDYSRFDNIDDSGSDSDVESTPAIPVIERLARALALKDSGNDAFQRQDWEAAKTSYQDGIKMLEPHKASVPPTVTEVQRDEIQHLLGTLHSNKAMVLLKIEDWSAAIKASSEALKIDSRNLKALFRRGVAYSRNGMLEEAKADLIQLIDADPSNNAAKKELVNVRKRIDEHHRKQKASFAGLFDRGSGMYEDKERERQRREQKEAEKKLQEEDEWRKDNIRKRDLGQSEQTFEDWKKKKENEAKEAKQAANPPPSKSSKPAKRKEQTAEETDEYDEEEQKIINETKQKGYCYFRRQPSEEVQQLVGNIAPKKVGNDDGNAASNNDGNSSADNEEQAKRSGASAWNFAGTFEERDVSDWAKSRLTELCTEAAVSDEGLSAQPDPDAFVKAMSEIDLTTLSDPNASNGMEQLSRLSAQFASVDARITKAKKIEGDAQIAVVRGTKRYLFDFNMQLEFEVQVEEKSPSHMMDNNSTDSEHQVKKFKGSLNFQEVSNTAAETEWECNISWKSAPTPLYRERVQLVTDKLRRAVCEKVEVFASEYAAM